jgi:hypothetical protein
MFPSHRSTMSAPNHARRTRSLAWLGLILATACAAGCVSYNNGQHVGAGAAMALSRIVGVDPPLAGGGPYAGTVDSPAPCGGDHCGCTDCVGQCNHCQALVGPFASAANFCIRPIAYAPADLPPPGRFHPVPTQPVFSPRGVAPQPLP